jgi:archaemetzincin
VKAISIVALGAVDEDVLAALEMCLWQSFGFETRRLGSQPEPTYAMDSQRGQYSSVLMLRKLVECVSADDIKLIGITEKDLFIPMLSFVFGQAQLSGSAAIVSLARLHQKFYGLPPNRMLTISRAIKEAIHEAGHTFGLTHCPDTQCPMSLSNSVRQVDTKGEELCKGCSIILEEQTNHIRASLTGGAKVKK